MAVDQGPASAPEGAGEEPVVETRAPRPSFLHGLTGIGFWRGLFWAYVFVTLIVFTFLVPPFQKADEAAHYLRAVSLTNLDIVCEKDANGVAYFPMERRYAELPDAMRYWETATIFEPEGTPKRKFDWQWLKTDFSDPRFDEQAGFYRFCGLPFAGYLPSAAAILLLKPLDNPLPGFYLSRVFGIAFFFACFWLALRKTPERYKPLVYVFAAVPMLLHQVSAVSYDAVHLPILLLVFAYLTKFMHDSGPITKRDLIVFMIALWFAINIRLLSYVPLLLLYFAVDWRKVAPRLSDYAMITSTFFVVTAVTSILMLSMYLGSATAPEGNLPGQVDSSAQIRFVIDNPTHFVSASYEALRQGEYLTKQVFASFGWNDYGYSFFPYFLALFMGGFALYRFVDRDVAVSRPWQALVILSAVLLTCVAIFGSLYAVWSPVGADVVTGLQGRYFLGLLPIAVFGVSQLATTVGKQRAMQALVVGVALVVVYNTLRAVLLRY